jgi:mannose-1-phosphate guanylyltransferase
MNKHHYLAIMAGGVGSRFWPESRTNHPKQFIDILGIGKSLIRMTYERYLPIIPKENIYIVTNELYRDLVKKHIPEISDNQILCEPSRNNTAPSVAYTTWKLHALDPKSSFIMASSDHLILNEDKLRSNMLKALDFVEKHDSLVTLAIEPSRPDTGYGYIQYESTNIDGVHKVKKFVEKPDSTTAENYVQSGEYLWNSGMFVWKTSDLITAFQKYNREIFDIFELGKSFYNTNKEDQFIQEFYPKTPSISIDYAILEHATNVYTIPSEFGWSDLGTWASMFSEVEKDENGNLLKCDKKIILDTNNSLVRAGDNKLVVIKGLDNYIVVDNDDILLIYPMKDEQEIKKVTNDVQNKYGINYI